MGRWERGNVQRRCRSFPRALQLLAERRGAVEDLITATYPLERGGEAFAAAAGPDHVKVLLEIGAA